MSEMFEEYEALALRHTLQGSLDVLQRQRNRIETVEQHVSRIVSLISEYSDPVVQRALTLPPDGSYLLHEICDVPNPTEPIVRVVKLFLEKEQRHQRPVVQRCNPCYFDRVALHLVCDKTTYTKHTTAIVELLLKHDASKESLRTPEILFGYLPIHYVCR